MKYAGKTRVQSLGKLEEEDRAEAGDEKETKRRRRRE
jgi:hypothetical protein